MHRVASDNYIVDSNGNNIFTDGPPGTTVPADMMNAFQEEICGVIETAGYSLYQSTNDQYGQLYQAIQSLVTTFDYVVTSQTTFNAIIERVAANQYRIKSNYQSVYFKTITGGYAMYGGNSPLSGGDTWGYLETGSCTRLFAESGGYINVGDTQCYVKVITDDCILDNIWVKGIGSSAVAASQSFLLAAYRVTFNNCKTSNRLSNSSFVGFKKSTTDEHNETVFYINCSMFLMDTEQTSSILGFEDETKTINCNVYDINGSLQIIKYNRNDIKQIIGNRISKTWTARSASEANSWYSICWSPELSLFCAVSINGTNRVMTSPDGITWTARSASEANSWYSTCWSPELSLFCAVSNTGTNRVMTSPDGITWTARSASEDNQWSSICWSPELSLFCAVSMTGTNRVMTSPNGITWTARSASEANQWLSICWSPELSLFCAVSTNGTNRVMTSPDGITWTARSASEANSWYSICWSPELSLFCAVCGDGTNRVMTSPDGITWTARSASEANQWLSICWSPELSLFCAVSNDGTNRVMTSPDGITWTARSASEANLWYSTCWSPELSLFCAVSNDGTNRVMTTT